MDSKELAKHYEMREKFADSLSQVMGGSDDDSAAEVAYQISRFNPHLVPKLLGVINPHALEVTNDTV